MANSKKPKKSKVVSLRLDRQQVNRLSKMSKKTGLTIDELAIRLVEEGLRRTEFAHIDFRSSARGRNAYIMGSRLSIPEVIIIASIYEYDVDKTAEHLSWPAFKIEAAINYWQSFRKEVDLAIKELESVSLESLKSKLPQMEVYEWGHPRSLDS